MNRRAGAYGIMVLMLGLLLSSYRPAAPVPESPVPVPTEIRQTAGKGKPLGKKLPDSRKDRIARATVTVSVTTIFPFPSFIESNQGTVIGRFPSDMPLAVVPNRGRTCHFPHIFPSHYFW